LVINIVKEGINFHTNFILMEFQVNIKFGFGLFGIIIEGDIMNSTFNCFEGYIMVCRSPWDLAKFIHYMALAFFSVSNRLRLLVGEEVR
jgi:hypothetical protein